ncbi:hypothetical protein [Bradyrhizobium sp.]|uniref:hypothetical protein n=1 Tax=Bradyrhizobium sp. TaxID=376 RepID=UPI003C3484AF
MAYTMVAKQDDQTVRKQRSSALIVMATARVWESEGWDITITDADGNQFDLAGFEQSQAQASSWLQAKHVPAVAAPDVQPMEGIEASLEHAEPDIEQPESIDDAFESMEYAEEDMAEYSEETADAEGHVEAEGNVEAA